jgi:hypothetical protein
MYVLKLGKLCKRYKYSHQLLKSYYSETAKGGKLLLDVLVWSLKCRFSQTISVQKFV